MTQDARFPAFGSLTAQVAPTRVLLVTGISGAGKRYLTIAIGCTGGRHRSVFAAETTARQLSADGHRVSLRHRGIESRIE